MGWASGPASANSSSVSALSWNGNGGAPSEWQEPPKIPRRETHLGLVKEPKRVAAALAAVADIGADRAVRPGVTGPIVLIQARP